MERGSAGSLCGIRNCYESVIPERILSHRTGVSGSDLYQSGGGVKNPELHLKQNKRSMEGRGFVRKSSPSAFVIGRNDWVVGKINHIGGLQNGEVHLQ